MQSLLSLKETGLWENLTHDQTVILYGAYQMVASPKLINFDQANTQYFHYPKSHVSTGHPKRENVPFTAESLRTFLLNHHRNISATGEPNLILYGRWKFGVTWYEDVIQQLSYIPS